MSKNDLAVIMAGGIGIMHKSQYPPVLAKVLGRPMISRVTAAVIGAGIKNVVIVIPKNDEYIKEQINGEFPKKNISFVEQPTPMGTAHAVLQASSQIADCADSKGNVLVLNGDTPFIDAATINSAYKQHASRNHDMTVISAIVAKPFGYGRIVRSPANTFAGIIEERDASSEIKRITEISAGTYWFKASALQFILSNLTPRSNGHYNLVDAVPLMLSKDMGVDTYFASNSDIILGANDRQQIMELNNYAKMREIEFHLAAGVDIPYSDGVVIEEGVEIGIDTTILPGTIIKAGSKIGKDCVIGPDTYICNSTIGDNVKLNHVQCNDAVVKNGADIGPYVQIRPNSVIGENVHLGNFVEVKNSNIDTGTKVSHLTYVGDSDVGKRVNFGCGTVTVNYTGKAKYRTTIGDDVFIGCNTNLVAPVSLGNGAYTAAGSTITEDVPEDSLGIARARQVNKLGWKVKK